MTETPHTANGVALINPENVKSVVSSAEIALRACWEKLALLQSCGASKKERLDTLISFQPALLSTLFYLESFYNEVCKKERQLVAQETIVKQRLKDEIARIEHYKQMLDGIIDIGKSLGDAFAWLFYLHSRPLLRKHYKHEFIPRLPTRIGGTGEVEFIRNCQIFGRYFVLSHSITTYLREGDVSLVDPSTYQVVAIGELKTVKKSPTEIITTIFIFGSKRLRRTMLPRRPRNTSSEPSKSNWDPSFKERLEKQVKNMKGFFEKSTTPTTRDALNMSLALGKLEKLFAKSSTDDWGHVRVGRGLLLIGVRSEDSPWANHVAKGRQHESELYKQNMDRIPKVAREIVDKNLPYNSLIIGSMIYPAKERYELELKTRPLFWWPLRLEVRKAITFKDMRIMTIYNPVFLIKALRDAGFDVELKGGSDLHITKQYGAGRLRIVGMKYLYKLIQTHLFTEDTVVKMLQKAVEKVEKSQIKESAYVSLDFDFAFL